MGLSLPWASLRAPVELGHGAAWLPVTTPGNPAPETVAGATDTIWAWVDAHLSPDTRLVPIGFSHGGLMASQLLRTRPERVVAPVILSGFAQDLDVVLFLGDYIYEAPGVETAEEALAQRRYLGGFPVTLDDYRARYAITRLDAQIAEAHARLPWIITFDGTE